MRLNIKAVAGVGAAAFAATGWGLYGSKGTQPTTLTKEETKPENHFISEPAPVNGLIKEQQRLVWEINTRDGIIDYKNTQIEGLKTEIEMLEKLAEEWEKYAEDLEDELEQKGNV